jgi:L,D-peptidoglycan transpeptidase YkuD (ErfK/YbiS/YcfS/YnhG family)
MRCITQKKKQICSRHSGAQPRAAPATLHRGLLRLIRPAPSLAPSRGYLQSGQSFFPCVIGAAGVSRAKREGDRATPHGRFEILGGYFRADRGVRPRWLRPLMPMRDSDGWCDDPTSYLYNRPVQLPQARSCETLTMAVRSYDIVLVLDYNLSPRCLGRGSAIFFHLSTPDWTPTAGCIAIAPSDMRKLLPRLRAGASIEVA